MKTVFKYKLDCSISEISIPLNATLLCVASQGSEIFLWAEVETDFPLHIRKFHLVGTGEKLPDFSENIKYFGTAFVAKFVFHVYEVIENSPK